MRGRVGNKWKNRWSVITAELSSKSLMEKLLSTIPTLARQSLEIGSFLWNWDQFVYGRHFQMGEILKLPLWGETSSTVNKSRYLSHVSSPIKFCPFYHDKSSLPVSLVKASLDFNYAEVSEMGTFIGRELISHFCLLRVSDLYGWRFFYLRHDTTPFAKHRHGIRFRKMLCMWNFVNFSKP